MPAPEPARARAAPTHPVRVGAAVVLGWVAHDLALFLAYGWPADALRLLPRSALAVLVGAAVGLACQRSRRIGVGLFVLGALAAGWPDLLPLSVTARSLPRIALLLFVAGAAAVCLARSVRAVPATRLGFALGVLCCLVVTARRQSLEEVSWILGASAAGSVLFAALESLPLRRVLANAALLVPVLWLGLRMEAFLSLSRPDLPPPAAPADAAAPSLLLIVLDTLRADHLASYGYERETTPRLDAFARDHATLFSAARSTSSWTLPSHASLFTGLLPAQHGVTHPRTEEHASALLGRGFVAHPLRSGVRTIAERMRERGYRTGAVLSNASTLRVEYGMDRGFEHYDARRASYVRGYVALAQRLGAPLWVGHKPYRDARVITDLALEWLDGLQGAPFFLTLNYMEAHLPYLPPPGYQRLFDERRPSDPLHPEKELWSLLYDRELRFLDDELGRLFDGLAERGLFDRTAIVVTSDHGEAFGDHGLWKHDWFLYDELVRVPLFVKPAGGARRRAVDHTPITGAEVHDRMLQLVGVEPPVRTDPEHFGEWYHLSTIPLTAEPPLTKDALARDLVAWIEDGRKWIVTSRGDVEAFDLLNDPAERAPLALSDAELLAARTRAEAYWAAFPPPLDDLGAPMQDADVDDEMIERLRGLGYVGDEDE